jgi:hypothetical protein
MHMLPAFMLAVGLAMGGAVFDSAALAQTQTQAQSSQSQTTTGAAPQGTRSEIRHRQPDAANVPNEGVGVSPLDRQTDHDLHICRGC